ncbi:Glyoxalase/Bleomycin resistance protein/Dihydroxybiphenyl dioxygenase [Acaromyces ingoldii]|uniref:Glyoxalase/Bleomycin resistance protein/Dihydroxybiphenyl dioxygenase n=1 Tax=Acaromyces ingoldii TaxID=215250 RepID=A0A316YK81_9BASI|nr:Glyoxalase/Bleomycin resistance protein/Dihydroxybiphenyl dioxygenase [Acaromyces ingoldii]PWN89611.1 Glyoxalase/Bleomycin resistance protein/Dihydroxybiphenyl dioxygenase [Acaromyces ingoldii]
MVLGFSSSKGKKAREASEGGSSAQASAKPPDAEPKTVPQGMPSSSSASSSQPRTPANGASSDVEGAAGRGEREVYSFHSTCLQIKDPIRSLQFYRDILGMEVVKESEADEYSMIFLGFKTGDEEEQFGVRQGLLQLVYVHGSEEDDDFKIKTGGPGFSHFSIGVPDVERARKRMESLGVEIVEDGSNAAGFAAVADPDGYHIQLMSQSIGQDDKLRKQLEALMRTPSSAFTLDSMSMQNRGDGLESITTRDSYNSSDALRFAKGGSPVSPSSPVHPSSSPQMYINQQS